MRDIKFRGKCKDKWVYGFLTSAYFEKCTIDGKALNIHRHAIDSYQEQKETHISGDTIYVVPTRYHVDEETIGQYTGLRDKNGVEIYEGDIVRVSDFGYNVKVGKIVYNEKAALYQVVAPLFICALGCYAEGTVDIEVIGNIHDNPELLEVEE